MSAEGVVAVVPLTNLEIGNKGRTVWLEPELARALADQELVRYAQEEEADGDGSPSESVLSAGESGGRTGKHKPGPADL